MTQSILSTFFSLSEKWCCDAPRLHGWIQQCFSAPWREKHYTIYGLTMSREAAWKTTCVTGGWGLGPMWLQCKAQLLEHGNMQRLCSITYCSPRPSWSYADNEYTHQWSSSALKMSIIKFVTWTSAYNPAVRQNIVAVPCYIFYNLLNVVIFLGKHTFFNTETSSLWM